LAEKSYLWETTTGTGDSDVSGYDDNTLFQIFRSLFCRTSNLGGVTPDFQNELAVSGTSSPLSVNTGFALVYGIPYSNSAGLGVTVPTPAVSTRIDRIVLRASWSAETVRITRIAGTEGAGAPSLTQTAGTTWDIPLAQASITTGGIITLTDQREWLIAVGDLTIDSTKLAAHAVTVGKQAQAAADTMLGNFTGSTADITATAVATILAQYVHEATSKASPVSSDEILLVDTEASNVLKKTTFAAVASVTTGTFTPALAGSVSSAGITYSAQSGTYAKIGSLVLYTVAVALSSKGTASGNLTITNLPYTANASGSFWTSVAWQTSSPTFVNMMAVVVNLSTTIALRAIASASTNLAGDPLTAAEIDNGTEFIFSGWYITT